MVKGTPWPFQAPAAPPAWRLPGLYWGTNSTQSNLFVLVQSLREPLSATAKDLVKWRSLRTLYGILTGEAYNQTEAYHMPGICRQNRLDHGAQGCELTRLSMSWYAASPIAPKLDSHLSLAG